MRDETTLHHGALDKPGSYGAPDAPRHEEIAGALPPANWVEKDPQTGFQTYPKRNQGGSDDCVEFSIAKAFSVDFLNLTGYYRELSPHSIYPFVFQPGGGSDTIAAIQWAIKNGVSLESLFASDNLGEADAESPNGYGSDAKAIATYFRVPGYVQCPTDFETIASILQAYQQQGKKKVVMVTIVGKNNGTWYASQPTPPSGPIDFSDPTLWFHKVPVCDFGLIDGQKVLAIDNSWGTEPGNQGQQFLTEAYAPYMYGGVYTQNPVDPTVASEAQPPKPPVHTWTEALGPGSTGPEVLVLQQALQSLGFFPVSTVIAPTGTYAGITKQAVETFQAAFGLPVTGSVDVPTPETEEKGIETTAQKLNSIFNQKPASAGLDS